MEETQGSEAENPGQRTDQVVAIGRQGPHLGKTPPDKFCRSGEDYRDQPEDHGQRKPGGWPFDFERGKIDEVRTLPFDRDRKLDHADHEDRQ